MSDYEKCGCGFWTLEPQEAWHDESRKYGVVRHRRHAPCWATPNDPPDSEMVEWTWRRRAEAAEAEVERLTADIADRDRRIESAWELCSAWEEIPADELVSALRGTE